MNDEIKETKETKEGMKVEAVTGRALVNSLADEMPKISQHAIDSTTEKEPGRSGGTPLLDKYGQSFDAAIHEVDANGEPLKNWKGLLKMRRGVTRGKKPAVKSTLGSEGEPVSEYHLIALTTVEMIYGAGRLIGGDAAAPKKIIDQETKQVLYSEYSTQLTAWTAYYKHVDMKNVHPIVLVLSATGGYAVRVATTDLGKKRASSLWAKTKEKFGKVIKRKHAFDKEKKDESQPENVVIEMNDIPADDLPPKI